MFEDDEPEGACIGCGLLQLINRGKPGQHEVIRRIRFGALGSFMSLTCFVRASDLEGEAEKFKRVYEAFGSEPNQSHNAAYRAVIKRERNCPDWFRWTEHFDPAWQLQERGRIQLEAQRRSYEEHQESERRKFEKGLAAEIEADRRKWEKETGKWPNRLVWAAVILALAQVIGTILALPAVTRWLGLN